MHIDYAVSDDCINVNSFGEICVGCGCCSRNPDYMDMIRKRIKHYKEMLEKEYNFSEWSDNEKTRALQERNVEANISYFKNEICTCEKILKMEDGVEEMAELIRKDALLENLDNMVYNRQNADELYCEVKNLVHVMPTTTESEIRASVIDEFAEKLKRNFRDIGAFTGYEVKREIDEITEQLKERE